MPQQLRGDTALVELLRAAISAAAGDDGYAPLAHVGSIVTKRKTDFEARTYGYPKPGRRFVREWSRKPM